MTQLGQHEYIVRGGYTAGALQAARGKQLLKPALTNGGNSGPTIHLTIRLDDEQFPALGTWQGETVPDGNPVLIFPGKANMPTIIRVHL